MDRSILAIYVGGHHDALARRSQQKNASVTGSEEEHTLNQRKGRPFTDSSSCQHSVKSLPAQHQNLVFKPNKLGHGCALAVIQQH